MPPPEPRRLLRALHLAAGAVFVCSAVIAVGLVVWALAVGARSPLVEAVAGAVRVAGMEIADPLDPATVERGSEVVGLIRSGTLRPGLDYAWDVMGPDSDPHLLWSYEAVIRLPEEYEDLSFRGEVDAEYFPGRGELRVEFYQGGGVFGPIRDFYLVYDNSEWTPGPAGRALAEGWWYVANAY